MASRASAEGDGEMIEGINRDSLSAFRATLAASPRSNPSLLLCLPPGGGRASRCQLMPRDGDALEVVQMQEEAATG